MEFREAERQANEIREALTSLRDGAREAVPGGKGSEGSGDLPVLRGNHNAGCERALASSAAVRSGFNTAGAIVGAVSSGVHDRVVGMGKLFGKEVLP